MLSKMQIFRSFLPALVLAVFLLSGGCGDTSASRLSVKMGASIKQLPVWESKTETKQEEIAFETVNQYDSSTGQGQTYVQQEGKPGLKEVQYKIIILNGSEYRRDVFGEKVILAPVSQIIIYGTGGESSASPSGSSEGGQSNSGSQAPASAPTPRISVICDDGTYVRDAAQCAGHGGACQNGYYYETGCF